MTRRRYPVLEGRVGQKLPAKRTATTPAPSGRRSLPQRLDGTRTLTPQHKLQALLEKTVKTLLMTASPAGDLTFRADIDAAVMNDLSVDVALWGREVVITFYTQDSSVRRLLQGYERELIAHLESRRLKVKQVRFMNAPDPNEAPAVPIGRDT